MDSADWTNPERPVSRRGAASRACDRRRATQSWRRDRVQRRRRCRARCTGPSPATATPGTCASTPRCRRDCPTAAPSAPRTTRLLAPRSVVIVSEAPDPASRRRSRGVEPARPRSSSPRQRASPRIGGMSPASGTSSAPTPSARCSPRWASRPRPRPTRASISPPLPRCASRRRFDRATSIAGAPGPGQTRRRPRR